jgi:hypothetical protein
MKTMPPVLTRTFSEFFQSEKVAAGLLLICTLVALALANSSMSASYLSFWQMPVLGLSLEHWVNDALMAVFFLLIGLELERELYVGELSDLRNAWRNSDSSWYRHPNGHRHCLCFGRTRCFGQSRAALAEDIPHGIGRDG